MWEISEEGAEGVLGWMGKINVCNVEYRVVEGSRVIDMKIHDLIHDYCMMQADAKDDEGVKHWHGKVVKGYRKKYVDDGGGSANTGWWCEKAGDDAHVM